DKSLRNIRDPRNEYGEMQIAGEILACGDENIREAGEISDQVLFAVRFISTHVTFYKAEISEKYWNELSIGLPDKYSVAIKRWPGENKKLSGLDLADPEGRIAVLTALTKIRQFLL
ncbi:25774_t:CDS:1, partial [Racocetra persica]